MKLGSQTGSLINHLYSRMTNGQPEPVVGMGVTFLSWSDRDAGTIVEVIPTKTGWIIATTDDDAKRIDSNGMSESQTYAYTSRPDGHRSHWRFDDKGWRSVIRNIKGRWVLTGSTTGLRIGERRKYHDFSF